MLLTSANYFSPEANRQYMSHSQYQDFMTCEAMAMAKLSGTWKREPSIEQKVGSYVHAWNEGTLEQFKAANPDIFKKDGTLYAQFQYADAMIKALQNDFLCMYYLEGYKEIILTAEFAGTPWKVKIDSYVPGQRIVDLKTAADLYGLYWSDFYHDKVSFIENYNYPTQMAIYCHIEKLTAKGDKWLDPYIVAVTKETPPDKAVISLCDTDRIANELSIVEQNMPRILEVKHGEQEPVRCERCPYCRATKVVTETIFYQDLYRKEVV